MDKDDRQSGRLLTRREALTALGATGALLRQPLPTLAVVCRRPLIGVLVALLLLATGKGFGVSASFQHLCAVALAGALLGAWTHGQLKLRLPH